MTNDDLPFGHQTWLENPIMEVFMGTSYIRVNLITTEACSPETWNQGECIGKSSPQLAELFRFVNYYNLPRYMNSGYSGYSGFSIATFARKHRNEL